MRIVIIALAFMAAMLTLPNAAFADGHGAGDAQEGAKVFRKCAACHMVGEGAKNRVGPVLTGVVGRPAASFEGYKYGKSLKAAAEAGLVWSEAELFAYLANPRNYLRAKLDDRKARSKMAFKLNKAQDRADVIAYLKSVGGN